MAYQSSAFQQPQMFQTNQPSFGQQLAQLGIQAGFQGLGAGLNYGIRDAFKPDPVDPAAMAQADAIVNQAAATGGLPGGMTTGETATVGGVSGALSGASSGAGIGTAIMPGLGTAIGAGIGTLVGGLGGALLPFFFEQEPPERQGPSNMQMLAAQGPVMLPAPQQPLSLQQYEQMLSSPSLSQQYGVQSPFGYGSFSQLG